jgi:hypothetical protein
VKPDREPISTRQEYPRHRERPCSERRERGRGRRRGGSGRGCAVARGLSSGLTAGTEDGKGQKHWEDRAFAHDPMLRTK